MIDADHPLLLGSASPRRREILATLELPLRVAAADIDETPHAGEKPLAYLERMAHAKLDAVVRLPGAKGAGGVLVADTTVILDDRPLGKPADAAEARRMLRALSGRAHHVSTCFAVSGPTAAHRGVPLHLETVTTEVRFRALDDETIALYAATGEGLDKAGAYAIQGIGSYAVARIEGSYSNVVGLPASEVITALLATGLLARFPLPRA